MTGRRVAVITPDLSEVDDSCREGVRPSLGEAARTVLWRLRQEIGHHSWRAVTVRERRIRGWSSSVPVALVGLVVGGLALAACTGSSDSGSGSESVSADGAEVSSSTVPVRAVRRPTIQLGVTDWTGARLNGAIAERLIERRLGYPVETVEIVDLLDMADDLVTGDIDAVLELWPSTLLDNEREVIEGGDIVDLGPLGVEGKVGWFVPRYVAEGELGVTGWEALVDPAVAAAFATPETGGRGRFLGTDPSYEQYDEQLIEALGLPFEVIYSGSEAATEAEVAAAVAAEAPIVLYWWRPTALVERYDLVSVALPERTAACVEEMAAGEGFRCDYPVDELRKLASPGLAAEAPEVERFLRAMRFTTDGQEQMIGRVDNDGRTVAEVADDWIEANGATWEAWFE